MASASVCKTIDFAPDFLTMTGLREGFTYAFLIEFTDRDTGSPLVITGDDFEMIIKDSTGSVVETLTTTPASGLTIDNTDLLGLMSFAITEPAGNYTFLIIWTVTDTGAIVPAVEGKIIVE